MGEEPSSCCSCALGAEAQSLIPHSCGDRSCLLTASRRYEGTGMSGKCLEQLLSVPRHSFYLEGPDQLQRGERWGAWDGMSAEGTARPRKKNSRSEGAEA